MTRIERVDPREMCRVMMRLLSVCSLSVLATAPAVRAHSPPAAAVAFNRDIRPILSDNCFQCHGPDKANRKAKLRLDSEESAFADRGGYHAIVAGKPSESEMVRRITAKGKERMPPPTSAHGLTAAQIDLIRRWIAEGAKWQKHWSLIPPRRP